MTSRKWPEFTRLHAPQDNFDVLTASPPAIPIVGDVLRYTISPLLGAAMLPLILRTMFGPPKVPARFKEAFPLSLILRSWQIRASAAEAALMIPAAMKMSPRYKELSMPVTILAGTADRVVTTERQSARLHDELAVSTFKAVPGVGHMIHHSVPDQVLVALNAPLALGRVA